jgi:hypothetical protein
MPSSVPVNNYLHDSARMLEGGMSEEKRGQFWRGVILAVVIFAALSMARWMGAHGF